MIQIKDANEVCGEIERVWCAEYRNTLLLIFADGRYAHYLACSGYDGDKWIEFSTDTPDDEDLRDAEIIAPEEYERRAAEQRARWQQASESQERKQLARLKAKYGE